MRATFRQPFDLLEDTNAIVARHVSGNWASSAKKESWLWDQSAANRSPPAIAAVLIGTGNFHRLGPETGMVVARALRDLPFLRSRSMG